MTDIIRTQTGFFNHRMHSARSPITPCPDQVPIMVLPAFSVEVSVELIIGIWFRGETSSSH